MGQRQFRLRGEGGEKQGRAAPCDTSILNVVLCVPLPLLLLGAGGNRSVSSEAVWSASRYRHRSLLEERMTEEITGRAPLPECPEGMWSDESGWAIIHIDTLEDFFAVFRPGCTVAVL